MRSDGDGGVLFSLSVAVIARDQLETCAVFYDLLIAIAVVAAAGCRSKGGTTRRRRRVTAQRASYRWFKSSASLWSRSFINV